METFKTCTEFLLQDSQPILQAGPLTCMRVHIKLLYRADHTPNALEIWLLCTFNQGFKAVKWVVLSSFVVVHPADGTLSKGCPAQEESPAGKPFDNVY